MRQYSLLLATITTGLLAWQTKAQHHEPPFESPKELMAALQRVYETQDKELYWRLHCWSNVSPKCESVFKSTSISSFKATPRDRVVYDQFSIRPAPAYATKPRESQSGITKFNLPVDGIITFRSQGEATVRPGEKPLPFANEDLAYYGHDSQGNYWLAVEVFIPKTNVTPIATAPASATKPATNPISPQHPRGTNSHTPVNFTSPEATIRTMILAYCNNDVETAARCMDFRSVAGIKLRRKYPPPTAEAIAAEATRFEKVWRATFKEHGLPDYRGIKITSIGKPTPIPEGGFRVDCNVTGPKAMDRFVLRLCITSGGWKFILPPNRAPLVDDMKPFPSGLD